MPAVLQSLQALLRTFTRSRLDLEAFGENALMASAALDRLAHRAHLITITGASYRAHHRPKPLGKDRDEEGGGRPTVQ